MNILAETALQHIRTTLERVKIYVSRISSCIAREDFQGAIDEALRVLRLLGLRFPRRPTQLHIAIELLQVKILLLMKKPESLFNLPQMSDPVKLAAMHVIQYTGHAAFYVSPNLFALLATKSMRIAKKYGNAPQNTFAYACYGLILAAGLWDFKGAMKFADLGLALVEKTGRPCAGMHNNLCL